MRVIAKRRRRPALCLAQAAAMLVAAAGAAHAQAMSPMRGEIKSFADTFAVRVFPANPYAHRIAVEVRVYDETFAPIATAKVAPAVTLLAPQDNRGVLVVVPFDGRKERRVRICTESVPFTDKSTRMRTQVCGRFFATRLN